MPISKRCIAEFIGTFWLVFGGCGSAVLAAAFTAEAAKISPDTAFPLGIGLVGVSLAFGLTVMTMAYAIGHISGCHLNPAVSFGLWAGKRFPGSELLPYIGAQVGGAIVAAAMLFLIASGKPKYGLGPNGLAVNGFGELSPDGYSLLAAFITEFVLTFMFLIIIMGATDRRAPQGFAPVAIGLGLTLIHLIGIPVTNVSVNPARSFGPALIVALFGGHSLALAQVWLFWLAPILGAIAAGYLYLSVLSEPRAERERQTVETGS
ncbi:MAG TPA: aquaporin Z [Oculatellaceae cyanobacterium]